MKHLFLFLLLMSSVCTKAQTATITFTTQDTILVRIGKPVDGNFNNYDLTSINLYPGEDKEYNFEIQDLGIVYIEYSTGHKCELYVYPNAKITMGYGNKRTSIIGDGAQANNYYNNNSIWDLRKYEKELDERFSNCIQRGNGFPEILNCLRDSMPHISLNKFEEMCANDQVTPQIYNAIKKNLKYKECEALVKQYETLLDLENKGLQKNDSVLIYAVIDSLYKGCPPDENFSKDQAIGTYLPKYYNRLYSKLNADEKEKLVQGYGEDSFGLYVSYLLAPPSVRLSEYFSAFMVQYKFFANEFNKKKMLEYFSKEFPESESFAIISEVWRENQLLQDKPIIITDTVNSLKELATVKELEGKYIFIDLWASWCTPCRMEFTYNSELHKLLENYSNLTLLYISIDEEEKDWLSIINANLSGLHLRANEKLTKDIKENIYANGRMFIPRYIMLDSEGNVVNNKLPQPSRIIDLKKELDKIFAQIKFSI